MNKTGKSCVKNISPRYAGAFQLSQRVDYALALLTALVKNSEQDEESSIQRIANDQSLSFAFLQKVAGSLRQAGYIVASRGRNGGYRLVRAPESISLKELIELFDGPVGFMPYVRTNHECPRASLCSVRSGWRSIHEELDRVLAEKTLKSFIAS